MIPFDFIYLRPDTLQEAREAYRQLLSQGKQAMYYSGGSEIISMCRVGALKPDAVIDIKGIAECSGMSQGSGYIRIGAACDLATIKESKLFPLLGLACGRVADHTNRCRISLGGNLCGTIIYRETSLPLLLCDSEVTICGLDSQRTVPLGEVFRERMQLGLGELVTEVRIPEWAAHARHAHIKKTAVEKIDYPLVSVSAIWKDGALRVAFSGLCAYPFRSTEIEDALNDASLTVSERADRAARLLPAPVLSDAEGSGEYRRFVMISTITELLEGWENGTL
ncbi:MAG: xanthine dehydrogenase family protein subunit M [Eubacteriales bacterium]